MEWFAENSESGYKARLVMTPSAELNLGIETGRPVESVKELAAACDNYGDLAAPISSGSFPTAGMIVAPCSIRTLSDIANCNTHNLLSRAADVTLKEGRKLVLCPRETPLHKGHLRLMAQAADMGAVILPPMPAFYHKPQSVADIVDQTVGKILDQFAIPHELFKRWGGP